MDKKAIKDITTKNLPKIKIMRRRNILLNKTSISIDLLDVLSRTGAIGKQNTSQLQPAHRDQRGQAIVAVVGCITALGLIHK
jgi:hypothetical protein